MIDQRSVERAAEQFRLPEGSFEQLVRRRDRKRRNQRIAAGVVGIAVFVAAVWIVTSGLSFDRTQTPAATGPAEAIGPVPETDYLLDLDTTEMTPLPESIAGNQPDGRGSSNEYAASPDGSRLAYAEVGDNGESQIFVANLDGTGVEQVTHDLEAAFSPAWSPDGTRIAFEAIDGGHQVGLYVLDVASGESTQITGVNVHYERAGDASLQSLHPLEPQFTPDGSSLVYSGGSDGHLVIWIVPVAGGESTLLIGPDLNMRDAENGSLSPNGSLVTFLGSQIGGPGERWVAGVADTDGTDRRLLPDVYGIPCRSTPAGTWSPDGSRIVCSEASKVIVLDIATGAATPVAYGRGSIWLDDHTLLVSL